MISFSFREITLEGIGAAEGREQTWEQGNLLVVQGRNDEAKQEQVPFRTERLARFRRRSASRAFSLRIAGYKESCKAGV